MDREAAFVPGMGLGKRIASVATRVVDAAGVEMTYALCDEQWSADKAQVPAYVIKTCAAHGVLLKGPLLADAPVGLDALLRRELGCVCRTVELGLPGAENRRVLVVLGDDEGFGGLVAPKASRAAQHMARDLSDAYGIRIPQASAFDVMPAGKQGCADAAAQAVRFALERDAHVLAVAADSKTPNDADALLVQAARNAAAKADEDLAVEVVPGSIALARLAAGTFAHDVLLASARFASPLAALADGLAGGPGRVPCIGYGPGIEVFGVDAPAIDSGAPDPTGMVLAAALMLEALGEGAAARRIQDAVASVPAGGSVSLDGYADAVIARL